MLHLLRDEYRIKQVTKVTADTLEELADKLEGVDRAGLPRRDRRLQRRRQTERAVQPNVKDGRATARPRGARSRTGRNTIDEPPFEAYQVGCGITFTFGGLRDRRRDRRRCSTPILRPIPGLYAAGELVGGLFYFNYPGGTGLMSGAVFGRIAGAAAAGSQRL